MVVSFVDFGSTDERLYQQYLFASAIGDGSRIQFGGGTTGRIGCDVDTGGSGGLADDSTTSTVGVCTGNWRMDSLCVSEILDFFGAGSPPTGGNGRERCAASTVGFETVKESERCVEFSGAADDGQHRLRIDVGRVGFAEDDKLKEEAEFIRGKNWKRNQRKREAVRQAKRESRCGSELAVPEWRRKSPAGVNHVSVFDGCSEDTRNELRESRAKMLVARNKAQVAKAEAERVRAESSIKSRTIELQVEAERLKLDEAREKNIRARLAELPAGFAETVISEGVTSEIPSLSDGSVSPDSSISVAQANAMLRKMHELTVKVAALTAERDELIKKPEAKVVEPVVRKGGRGPPPRDVVAFQRRMKELDDKHNPQMYSKWDSPSLGFGTSCMYEV